MADPTNAEFALKLKKLKDHGINLYRDGKFGDSITCFDKVLEFNPEDTDALTNKGQALYGLKKFKESVDCFDKVLAVNRQDTDALNNKGNAMCHMGDYKAALKCYEGVLLLDPSHQQALKNRNIGLRAQGKQLVQQLRKLETRIAEAESVKKALDDEVENLNKKYEDISTKPVELPVNPNVAIIKEADSNSVPDANSNDVKQPLKIVVSMPSKPEPEIPIDHVSRERAEIERNLSQFESRLGDLDDRKKALLEKEKLLNEKQEALNLQEAEIIDKRTKHKLKRQEQVKELMEARLALEKEKNALKSERKSLKQVTFSSCTA